MTDLIQVKESRKYPGLFVKKYKKKVFFENLWGTNKELLEARGHVYDAAGNVVVNPFTKIFNYGENGTTIDLDETVLVVEKVNGFMACATYVKSVGDVVISTTGSLDSDFVDYAKSHLDEYVLDIVRLNEGYTFIFEICAENDPHIIKELNGAYLIGIRSVTDTAPYTSSAVKELLLDNLAKRMGVMRPSWREKKFDLVLKDSQGVDHEGFVVYGANTALKIKSKYYLTLKVAARKMDIMTLDKSKVDEEFYPLIDHIQQNKDEFNALDEQARLEYMKEFLRD